MATVLRVEVHNTVLDYRTISIPPTPGYPPVPVIVPYAASAGIWSLRGPFVSGVNLAQETDYRSAVRFLVQARLGSTFDVDLMDVASYPDLNPPPVWKYIPDAYNYTLMRNGMPYMEENQGLNAIAYVGYCLSIAPA